MQTYRSIRHRAVRWQPLLPQEQRKTAAEQRPPCYYFVRRIAFGPGFPPKTRSRWLIIFRRNSENSENCRVLMAGGGSYLSGCRRRRRGSRILGRGGGWGGPAP